MIDMQFLLQLIIALASIGVAYAAMKEGITKAILLASHAKETAEKAEKAADHAHSRLDSHIDSFHVKKG